MEAISGLTTFDSVIISIILISSLLAFMRGFVSAVLSFTNWIVSFLLVMYGAPIFAESLSGVVESESGALILASVLIFLASFIVFAIINSNIVKLVRQAGIGSIDRVLGLAFGMVRGVVIGVVIFMSIGTVFNMLSADDEEAGPEWLVDAKSYNLLQMGATMLMDYVPSDSVESAKERMQEIGGNAPALLGGFIAKPNPEQADFLSEKESELMDKAIAALPPYEVQQLSEKYGSNLAGMTDLEKRAFFKEIFRLYEDGAAMGVVPTDKRLSRQEYNELYQALQRAPVDESETGYKPGQLDDINRLINTVE